MKDGSIYVWVFIFLIMAGFILPQLYSGLANLIFNRNRKTASPGSKTSDAVWAVQKVTIVKGVLSFLWAGGSKAFGNIWDNRSKLIYS